MRQTDYDSETAKNKVKEFNGNVEAIVREFINPPTKKEEKKSVNQEIYGQIRGLMDDAARNFRNQQELNKLKEKYIAQLQKENQKVNLKENTNLDNISETEEM
jgi:succinate dehydrogenase/fumarate reductase flavoprotein subunit